MKKSLFIFGVVSVLFLVSCKENDLLTGSYRLTSIELSCPILADISFGSDGCITDSGTKFCESGGISFSSNGKFTNSIKLDITVGSNTKIYSLSSTGTYTVNGSTIKICEESQPCEYFTLSGNKLTGTYQDATGCKARLTLTKK